MEEAFLSHSNHDEDRKYIDLLYAAFYGMDIPLYVAEHSKNTEAGKGLDEKLEKHIVDKKYFIVLYTQYVKENPTVVHEEIGIAKNAKKKIIVIVEKGFNPGGIIIKEKEQIREFDRSKKNEDLVREIIDRIRATLNLQDQSKGTNEIELNDLDVKFMEYLINCDDSYASKKTLLNYLKISNSQYNITKNKLERGKYIVQEQDWYDNDEGWRLTSKGLQYFEAKLRI